MEEKGNLKKNLKLIENFPKNYCIGEKNPKKMSHKEYLHEFSKGKCNPTVIVPGLISTKLIVEIDCEVLEKENPTLFNYCGWERCKKSFFHVRLFF